MSLTVVPLFRGQGLRLFGPDNARPSGAIVSVIPVSTVTHIHMNLFLTSKGTSTARGSGVAGRAPVHRMSSSPHVSRVSSSLTSAAERPTAMSSSINMSPQWCRLALTSARTTIASKTWMTTARAMFRNVVDSHGRRSGSVLRAHATRCDLPHHFFKGLVWQYGHHGTGR